MQDLLQRNDLNLKVTKVEGWGGRTARKPRKGKAMENKFDISENSGKGPEDTAQSQGGK